MSNAQQSCPSSGGSAGKMASDIQDKMIESSLNKIGQKLLVMSGKGGVGKSSISANIAVGLASRGFKVGLMDVDLHGPSIHKIMGLKGLLDITEDKFIVPKPFNENLKIVSMQSLMQDGDQAVIWRGPAKTGVIRQFIADVQWDNLDYLVIDSPPGTGDEPLSVAQTVPDAKALIITTPQDVALDDVRKSINFCKTVHMEILGLIENMGPLTCPHCGKIIELFKSGGGEITAQKMDIPFLGSIPFDTNVVDACDAGKPVLISNQSSVFSKSIEKILDGIVK
ncbi:Iron-sulfur cluster carrier protein [Candidatus Magnetomoraceae bacterium gMMP-15]